MKIRIIHGTRSDGENLCRTCRNSQFIQGAAESKEVCICHQMPNGLERMNYPVAKCSKYSDVRLPSLNDMRDSAFYLVSKNARTIGFVKAADFKKQNADEYWKLDTNE